QKQRNQFQKKKIQVQCRDPCRFNGPELIQERLDLVTEQGFSTRKTDFIKEIVKRNALKCAK
ncbi:uncharacterized protein B0P05DRAFT_511300, partial [Gilbertella persicaria]|uniref:uncharacterized protein n=1 Tax=Gilbertella persicaria TaxID=101096 RepID=UPI00221EB3F0